MDLIIFSEDLLDDILKIECESFTNPWNRSMFLSSASNNCVTFKVLLKDKTTIGYYIINTVIDEIEIFNIAVSQKFRRQNFGKFMLTDIISEASLKKSKFVFLEVRKNNIPALNLYKSFGFKKIGIRTKYYKNEDAIVMRLTNC
jgi:ribosomal-protein-alanine N-acetyltransferase